MHSKPLRLRLIQHFAYVNDQQVAHLDEAGLLNVADALSGLDISALGSSVTTVQDGEHLPVGAVEPIFFSGQENARTAGERCLRACALKRPRSFESVRSGD